MRIINKYTFVLSFIVLAITFNSCVLENWQEHVDLYNKIKNPVNKQALTLESVGKTTQTINDMSYANIWVKIDKKHLHHLILSELDKNEKSETKTLAGVKLKSIDLSAQLLQANFELDNFTDKNNSVYISGVLSIFSIPIVKDGNFYFKFVASDLDLTSLSIKDKKLAKSDNSIIIGAINGVVNWSLPYLNNLIPESKVFGSEFTVANLDPKNIFSSLQCSEDPTDKTCLAYKGDQREILAYLEQSAVVINQDGLTIVAKAENKPLDSVLQLIVIPDEPELRQEFIKETTQATRDIINVMSVKNISSTVSIASEGDLYKALEQLQSRSITATDEINKVLTQSNYAFVSEDLLAALINTAGGSLNYGVSGSPYLKNSRIDGKLAYSSVKKQCKDLLRCRNHLSRQLQCHQSVNCERKTFKCNCSKHAYICKAARIACEPLRSTAILACYLGKGLTKGACEALKAAGNLGCTVQHVDEVTKSFDGFINCGVLATFSAENMGDINGDISFDVTNADIMLQNLGVLPNLGSLSVAVSAKINANIKGELTLKPRVEASKVISCLADTDLKINANIQLHENKIVFKGLRSKTKTDDTLVTHIYYAMEEVKLKVYLDQSIFNKIILSNPEFMAKCPFPTSLAILDFVFGDAVSSNATEIGLGGDELDLKIEPIKIKSGEVVLKIPVTLSKLPIQ